MLSVSAGGFYSITPSNGECVQQSASSPGGGVVTGADGSPAECEQLVGLCRMGAEAHQDPGSPWSH